MMSEHGAGLWQPTPAERDRLLASALHDAEQAVECMRQKDWLRADVLLKLAADQVADAGMLP